MTDNAQSKPSGVKRLFSGAYRRRFDILLACLTLLLLSAPAVQLMRSMLPNALPGIMVTALFTAMLLSAVFAVCNSRRTITAGLSLAVPTIVFQVLGVFVQNPVIVIVNHVFAVGFLGFTIVILLRFLFSVRRVTLNMIWASLCVYLLLGVLWAEVYSLVAVLDRRSFHYNLLEEAESRDELMQFGDAKSIYPLYFSLVTLTTLGYGDIVPLSATARMLAVVEAMMGQLYLAVLVARLVGLHIAGHKLANDEKPDDT